MLHWLELEEPFQSFKNASFQTNLQVLDEHSMAFLFFFFGKTKSYSWYNVWLQVDSHVTNIYKSDYYCYCINIDKVRNMPTLNNTEKKLWIEIL